MMIRNVWLIYQVFSRDSFPVDSEEIATPDQIKKWEYLDEITTSIPD